FLVIGASKVELLKANIQSLDIRLTKEQMPYLDSIVSFCLGFPLSTKLKCHDSRIAQQPGFTTPHEGLGINGNFL
ncbi:hypothetical protein ARMGADRAFT_942558, partial [Armillaria gallica]